MKRRITRIVKIGNVVIGGGHPVSVQSMTNTDTRNVDETVKQVNRLSEAGCQIVRVAVPDHESANSLSPIIEQSPIPVVADIHFDYRLALKALKAGVQGIRINPGNIGDEKRVSELARACLERNVPIRVGANSGSLPAKFANKLKNLNETEREEAIANALVESAIEQCRILEKHGFSLIKVSLKSSDVRTTVLANRIFSEKYDYPLHLGITEAGTKEGGIIKSSVGIGALLLDGIGDTIRISLTADPVQEVKAGIRLLEACGLRKACPEIVSCPVCGRAEINVEKLALTVEAEVERLKQSGNKFKPAKIAIMGCAVNGPGESKDADLGFSGGKEGKIVVFKDGKVIASLNEKEFESRVKFFLKYLFEI